MQKLLGGCDCGNISFAMELSIDPASINPRACDCDFCMKHNATYISDANGKLKITIKDKCNLSEYHQGSGIATFLICKNCGVLIGGCFETSSQRYAAINSKAVDRTIHFASDRVSSPKLLSDEEKKERWINLWFSGVEIEYIETGSA